MVLAACRIGIFTALTVAFTAWMFEPSMVKRVNFLSVAVTMLMFEQVVKVVRRRK